MSAGMRIDPRSLPLSMQVQLALIFVKQQEEKGKQNAD